MASNENLASFKKKATQAKNEMAHFFQPIDKGSSMPSWYYERHIEEENEWIKRNRNQLDRGLIPPDKIEMLKSELKAREVRLGHINEAEKTVKDLILADKDKAKKRFDRLAEAIAESMPTRDEMNHVPKLIDPRKEAERMPHRDKLVKLYKVYGRVLGEYVNVEALRR